MLEILLEKFAHYKKTQPISAVEDKCLTFIRDKRYLHYLQDIEEDIWVFTYSEFEKEITQYQSPSVKVYYSDWPEYEFTLLHNHIYKDYTPPKPLIGKDCKIHPTVIMDVDGLKLVHCPDGNKIQFKHTGRVIIEDGVEIGPYTIIHRGTMGATIIRSNCKIGAKNNIAHNCEIGSGTVMAVGVIFNGGVKTGENCWFGSGALIKHKAKITDNVVIGMGAVVTKDITKSGIYAGAPARFLKPIEKGWNF